MTSHRNADMVLLKRGNVQWGNSLCRCMDFDVSNLGFSTLTDMGQYCKKHVIIIDDGMMYVCYGPVILAEEISDFCESYCM